MAMNDEERALLMRAINKSGGLAKWRELLASWRRSCRSRDRAGIADLVRRSAKTEEGAVQLAMLVLLGLSLGNDVASDDEREQMLDGALADALGPYDG